MKRYILLLSLTLIATIALAQGSYYDNVISLSGQPLYNALHNLISTNTYSSYDGAKTFLFQTLDNVNGAVTCVYTGQVYPVSSGYNGSSNPNTEHTYAQSWFNSNVASDAVKKADLHHLFPTNSVVNSSRGNYPLFTVASHAAATVYYNDTPWQSYRGFSLGNQLVFEPCDESKGDIARALLYFNVRYYDTLTQQGVNMLPDLVAWNLADPPDAREIARNNAIHGFLGNRNPFVDHPEFVNRIWGVASDDPLETTPPQSLRLNQAYPNPFSDSVSLNVESKVAALTDVAVYNSRGQKIRSWSQSLSQGSSEIRWDGRDDRSQRQARGVYLIRISSGQASDSAKLLLD